MKEKPEAILGFAVNPEITWTDEGAPMGERIPARCDFHVSGTSYDIALALKICGIEPMLIGAVGANDIINKAIEEDLNRRGIKNLLLGMRESTPWACIEPESGRRLSFKEGITKIEVNAVSNLLTQSESKFKVLTGLMPDVLEMEMAKALFKGDGIRILIPSFKFAQDKKSMHELGRMTDWMFMNKHEAAAYLGCEPDKVTLKSIEAFLDLGPSMVVVTKDKDGAMMVDTEGRRKSLKAHPVKMKDETGAGDCFLGFFIASMHKGYSRDEALKIATVAGGLKASRMGTINIPTWQEVIKELK